MGELTVTFAPPVSAAPNTAGAEALRITAILPKAVSQHLAFVESFPQVVPPLMASVVPQTAMFAQLGSAVANTGTAALQPTIVRFPLVVRQAMVPRARRRCKSGWMSTWERLLILPDLGNNFLP